MNKARMNVDCNMIGDSVCIVADIGGTNARFAYITAHNTQLQAIEYFPCADFPFIADAFRHYIDKMGFKQIDRICLAAAGQVELDRIDLANNHWSFSRRELEQTLAVPIKVLNDFTAQTLSIGSLDESELLWIGSPRPGNAQVKAIIGPGTGLGVSAMMPKGDIVPSEAGHINFAPANVHEAELLRVLWQRYQRVSVERVLSGMGIANLYWANSVLQDAEKELSAAEVTQGASEGDALCMKTLEDFYAILGSVAGDVVLMMGAAGGLYLSGGILPKIKHLLNVDAFRACFENKGRLRGFCATVPIALVLAQHPGLLGCVEALKLDD